MGRISIADAEHYGNQKGGSWFSLKDDHDTAKVRFMYESIDDVQMDVVHEVEVDGKKRYVNCIRSYNEPADNCPLCRAGYKVTELADEIDKLNQNLEEWRRLNGGM